VALQRRSEIEGMLDAAGKMAGPRRAGVDAVRAECLKRFEEAKRAEEAAPLVARVREALGDVRRLRQRRKEIEDLISGVEKAGFRAEAEGLRAEAARTLEEAERRADLLGHWRLDGDARDSSGLDFHGRKKGTKTVPGKIGKALWFDGENDVVELPLTAALNQVQAESYTLAAWFRPEDIPPGVKDEDNRSWYAVIVKEGMHIGLSYPRDQHIEMGHWAEGGTRAIATGKSACPPGSWHHLAGVVDREKGRTHVYVNGAPDGTVEWAAGKASRDYGSRPWRIGHAAPGSKEWAWPARGAIDDVRIYGRALPAEGIRRIYEAGLAGRDP